MARSIQRRMSKVGYRMGLLAVGLALAGTYAFITGGQTPGTAVSGVPQHEEPHSPVRKLLSEYDDDIAECYDKSVQDSVCIGYGGEACKRIPPKDLWGIIFVILGLLYLFVGIAIVCDELFVPALEIIAEDLHLSNDVAGATLMAAGGSAPELATSFVGVFKRSDVGFGTIVGSAVFNVLFVIGMCAMSTPKKFAPLGLTWWPLFRDCTYYVLTLSTLAAFMYDGEIQLWEAIIQFIMYLGYVCLMMYSEKLEHYVKTKLLGRASAPVSPGKDEEAGTKYESNDPNANLFVGGHGAAFTRPSTFRAGVLQLLTSKNDITETASVACVAQIKGDVNDVFEALDENKNGIIEPNELRKLLVDLGTKEEDLTDEVIKKAIQEIDKENTDKITKAEFVKWYTRSEERIRKQTRDVFNSFDSNQSGTIEKDEVKALLRKLGNKPDDEEIEKALSEINLTEGELNYGDFEKWYEGSIFWNQQTKAAEEAAESTESLWEGLVSGWKELSEPDTPLRAKIAYLITVPLTLLFCLVPDCRQPGAESRAPFTFIMSIVMIALLAIIMVELAEIFGRSLGIPDVVMGLTILAAGTSVPDLLSSVIVAKQGEGDMAVSSSIGSNIFDVAFGLPVPWMVFNIVAMINDCKCGVIVQSDGLFASLVVLLIMVAAIVVTIAACKWKMSQALGGVMFFLYFAYVAFSLITTPSKDYKVQKCSPFDPLG